MTDEQARQLFMDYGYWMRLKYFGMAQKVQRQLRANHFRIIDGYYRSWRATLLGFGSDAPLAFELISWCL